MEKALIGYQLYSAREEAEKDLLAVLKQLKQLGYDGVEFAGFYGHSAEEIAAMLKETEMVAISDHVPYSRIVSDMFGVISEHMKIGCKYIAIPYLDEGYRPGQEGFSDVIKNIFVFGSLCKQAGIQLLYHNHDFEFVPWSGAYGLDFLYSCIPSDILQTEIDTCWVKYSGLDPADYIRKYTGRAPIVHLKDFVGTKGEAQPYALINENGSDDGAASDNAVFEFRPVGYGCQDVPALLRAGKEAGAMCFVVEQDQWYGRNPLEAAEMSIRTLIKCDIKG